MVSNVIVSCITGLRISGISLAFNNRQFRRTIAISLVRMRFLYAIVVIVVPVVILLDAQPIEFDDIITNAIPQMNLSNPAVHNNVSINYVNIQSAQQVGPVDRGGYVSNILYSIFQVSSLLCIL